MRPESTYKSCLAWPQGSAQSATGRVKPVIEPDAAEKLPLRCILAEASAQEQTRFAQDNQHVTHVLVQQGKPIAARNWIIEHVGSGRRFWVASADNAGGLNHFTIYYCEEMVQ